MNVVHYHSDEGQRAAIAKRGRTKLHLLVIEGTGVRVEHHDFTVERQLRPMLYRGDDYPLARAARAFKRAVKVFGATKEALAFLEEVRA